MVIYLTLYVGNDEQLPSWAFSTVHKNTPLPITHHNTNTWVMMGKYRKLPQHYITTCYYLCTCSALPVTCFSIDTWVRMSKYRNHVQTMLWTMYYFIYTWSTKPNGGQHLNSAHENTYNSYFAHDPLQIWFMGQHGQVREAVNVHPILYTTRNFIAMCNFKYVSFRITRYIA